MSVTKTRGIRPARMDVPYAGLVNGAPYVHDAPHLLVSGRTGSSKTRSVLAIQAASWGGGLSSRSRRRAISQR